MTNWQPPADLTRLLEALSGEIVSSSDAEVQVASAPTVATARAMVARVLRMRELIGDAIDEPAELRERLPLPEPQPVGEWRQRSH